MKNPELDNHHVLKSTNTVVVPYLQRCNLKQMTKAVPSDLEKYALNCFEAIRNITNCMEQLDFSIDLLSGYRKSTSPDTMNRHDHIVFAIENYYLRITSVYDRCLRLINTLYQLGLPERDCKNSTIVKNTHLKNTDIETSLKALDKFTNNFRQYRNSVAHNETYSDDEKLSRISSYYFLEDQGDEAIIKFKSVYKKETDDYIKSKKTEFRNHLIELEIMIVTFLDAVDIKYHAMSEKLV